MTRPARFLVSCAAAMVVASAASASAQSNLSGTWSLDRAISGDPSRAVFEPVQAQRGRPGGGFSGVIPGIGGFGGRGGSGGRGGGGRGGSGDSGISQNTAVALTPEEKIRLGELTDYVKRSLGSLVISQADPAFTMTDGQGRTHQFLTDGTKTRQQLATATAECTTRWDGPRLVTDYAITSTRTLVFTYLLVPATSQMVLRIRVDESGRRVPDVDELRLVYSLSATGSPAPKPPAYSAFGGGHLLRSVSEDGRVLTLEDGSIWEVNPEERFKSVEWQPDASMTVRTARGLNGYDCELINTTEDEGVLAKLLPKPQH